MDATGRDELGGGLRTLARMRRRRSYADAADRRALTFRARRRTHRRWPDGGVSLTVGLSEDLVLLDPHTLRPLPTQAQATVAVAPAPTVREATRALRLARRTLVERVGGAALVAGGGMQPVVGDPTGAGGAPVAGSLRVHVAVAAADAALRVYNAARSYLPQLAALAASSPFLDGRDTGLASTRLKLAEGGREAGVPPAFCSWEAHDAFVDRTRTADGRELAWDLRLDARHGTLEFRVPDGQASIADAGAVAAVCQALVAGLARRLEDDAPLPVHESHAIAANRWRALRDGVEGELVDLDHRRRVPTRAALAALLAELEPFAPLLGSRAELARASRLAADNGATRQRALAGRTGLPGLVAALVAQTGA